VSATLIASQKGQQLTVLFDVVDSSYNLLTGQAALLAVTLRDEDGAATETVTITEQATAGYYKATFTPTKGGSPPKTYWLKIVESGTGQSGREADWLVQSYDALPAYAGATSDLTTLAAVRETLRLPVSETGDDAYLTRLISRISATVKRITRRALTQTTLTEIHDGRGRPSFRLRDWPVISFTSLHEDPDCAYPASTLLDPTEYVVDARIGEVTRLASMDFSRYPQALKAVYVAGYATVPEDLEHRVIQTIVEDWRTRKNEGVASKSLMDGSIVYYPVGDRQKALRDRFAIYALGGMAG